MAHPLSFSSITMGRFLVKEEDDGGGSGEQQEDGNNVEPWQDRCYRDDAPASSNRHDPVSTPSSQSSAAADASGGSSIVPYDTDGDSKHDDIGSEQREDSSNARLRRSQTWSEPFPRRQRHHCARDRRYGSSTIHEHDRGEVDDIDAWLYDDRMNSRIRMLFPHDRDDDNGGDRRVYGHVLSSPPQDQRHLYEAQLYGHGHNVDEQVSEAQLCHYDGHICMTDNEQHDDDITPPAPRKSTSKRFLIKALFFILAGTALAYMRTRAPPPPPPYHDWTNYLFSSTERVVGEVERISIDAGYILSGFVNNMYMDAVGLRDSILFPESGKRRGPKCHLKVPTYDSDNSVASSSSLIEDLLNGRIVGQERAVRVISRALDAWYAQQPASDECAVSDSDDFSAPYDGKPLVLLFTGSEGVGKHETARSLARLLFRHCTESQGRMRRVPMPDAVLQVDGPLFDESSNHVELYSLAQSLRDKVIEHVRRQQGAGAVIILRHFESLPAHLLSELFRSVKTLDAEYERNDLLRWDNVVFILTSDLGVDKLFKAVGAYEGIEFVPENDISLAVRNDIDDHFGEFAGMGNAISSIAIFMPLGMPQVESVLRSKIKQLSKQHEESVWKRLDVTERTLEHCGGPDHIEYLSLKKKNSESVILTFSKRGAHTVEDGICMQTLRSIRPRISPRPEFIAVFDWDHDSRQAAMKWCSDTAVADDKEVRPELLSDCEGPFWKGELG